MGGSGIASSGPNQRKVICMVCVVELRGGSSWPAVAMDRRAFEAVRVGEGLGRCQWEIGRLLLTNGPCM